MIRKLTIIAVTFILLFSGCTQKNKETGNQHQNSQLYMNLPEGYNTPDGMAMAPDGNLILSVPNFNNQYLMDKGEIEKPSAPFMALIDKDDNIHHWYDYKKEDMHPITGKIGPMDAAFGPDGNLYVADMQVFYDDQHQSRLIRINVENGKPTSMDVVVTGFIASNGVFWENNTIFVTESVLQKKQDTLISGVYAFDLSELTSRDKPVQLTPFTDTTADEHLVVSFTSDNHMGFGADGVTCDDEGFLYTTVIEKSKIYRSKLNKKNKAIKTELFAENQNMVAPDGLIFNKKRQKFYVADFLNNAVHSIDKDGTVTTLQKNGDVTGEKGMLDQPAEVIIRDDKLIVVNMDMAWASEGLSVNTQVDGKYNLAVIDLSK
jgi:sugar lactone lactonase YvrE